MSDTCGYGCNCDLCWAWEEGYRQGIADARPSPDGRRMAETENTGSGRKPDQQVPGSKTSGRSSDGGEG
jgi:hypothetical protein